MKKINRAAKMWFAVFVICAGVFALPRPAVAMYVAGGDLVKHCLSQNKHEVYSCVHYVAGVIDYHTVLQALGTAPTIPFCIPAGVSITEAAFVVTTYLRDYPQNQGFVAAISVPMALTKAYPCKKVPPKSRKKK